MEQADAFQFDTPGDTVTGQILTIEEVQQSDMETGEPTFWNNNPTQPKMMYRVTLQTELRDAPDDDGKRSVYLRGSRKPETRSSLAAVLGAVRAATGGTNIDQGATLALRYAGDGVPSRRGHNPPKQYDAQYTAPSVNLDQQPPSFGQQPPAQQGFPPQQPAAQPPF